MSKFKSASLINLTVTQRFITGTKNVGPEFSSLKYNIYFEHLSNDIH